jgi:hypothetical protein
MKIINRKEIENEKKREEDKRVLDWTTLIKH